MTSAPCPFTLFFQRGNQPAPNRFVNIVRRGEFDCGPRGVANIELQFVGTLVATNGSILRVAEGQPGWTYPVSITAKCSTGRPALGCPVRTFQSFEELFQASE